MSVSHARFAQNGFAKITGSAELKQFTDDIIREIKELAQSHEIDVSMGHRCASKPIPQGPNRTNFYRGLRYLPSLGRLANSHMLTALSKELGLARPIVMNASNIRMDDAGENVNKFHWHQDFTYLLGSKNSITYWIPLQDVSSTLGGIEVVAGSHKKGLAEFEVTNDVAKQKTSHISPNDIVLSSEPSQTATPMELNYGEAVVFSQFLLHRSLEHTGHHTRWTVQIRHSDATDAFFREHGCPMGDTTTILKQETLLNALKDR